MKDSRLYVSAVLQLIALITIYVFVYYFAIVIVAMLNPLFIVAGLGVFYLANQGANIFLPLAWAIIRSIFWGEKDALKKEIESKPMYVSIQITREAGRGRKKKENESKPVYVNGRKIDFEKDSLWYIVKSYIFFSLIAAFFDVFLFLYVEMPEVLAQIGGQTYYYNIIDFDATKRFLNYVFLIFGGFGVLLFFPSPLRDRWEKILERIKKYIKFRQEAEYKFG